MAINQPNATLYVSNMDWKIKKPLLKRALYSLFSRHGKVLEVVALRKDGLRGQAFVIFNNVQSATMALQAENGLTFFQKELKIAYANEKSDRISKRDGTYVPKAKRPKLDRNQNKDANTSSNNNETATAAEPHGEQPQDDSATTTTTTTTTTTQQPEQTSVPSHILFAQDLPEECNSIMLEMLFRQYTGFQEVRLPRPGLAFVEFDDEPHATLALQGLNGFKLTTKDTLNLAYGKS